MPQGQIRKGFFFYFGLFVLLLIAVFCICLVVMIFNPGKTVLWMQYFTANEPGKWLETTTDESKTPIDLSEIETLQINTSAYAKVVVQRDRDETFAEEGLYIVNNAKGFAAASNAVDFDYELTLSGTTLTLNLTEPTGFLYFSRDVQVVLAAFTDTTTNFGHINLVVNAVDGDVEVGATGLNAQDVRLASLDVETRNGDINLGVHFDMSTLTELNLSSQEGRIQSFRDVNYDNGKTGNGVNAQNLTEASFTTQSGLISFDAVDVGTSDLSIYCRSGNVNIDYIKANSTNVTCFQGNYRFNTVDSDLSFTNSENTMLAPNIVVNDKVTGDFNLSTSTEQNAEPSIYLKQVDGVVSILADRGSLNIDNAQSDISVKGDGAFNIDIVVGETNRGIIDVETNNGNVELGFLGDLNNVTASSASGNVDIKVTNVARFVANAYVNDGTDQPALLEDGKINVSHGFVDGDLVTSQTKNPLTVNGLSSVNGTLTIYTNNTLDYELVTKESLQA